MDKTKIIVTVLIIIFSFSLGGYFGYTVGAKQAQDSAIEAVTSTLPIIETDSISGTLESLASDHLVLKTFDITFGVQRDSDLSREIYFDPSVIVTREIQKDQQLYQQELEAYQRAIAPELDAQGLSTRPIPSPVTTEQITVADLRIGDLLGIVAQNIIQDGERIVAKSIAVRVQDLSALSAPALQGNQLPPPVLDPSQQIDPSLRTIEAENNL